VSRFAPDVIFHLAAQIDVRASVADPLFDADVNVLGTINVLEAARKAGTPRVIFASSGGATFGATDRIPTSESVPRHPESPYGVAKKVADEYLAYYHRMHGIDYLSLGFANVYGPGQDPSGEAGVVAIFISDLLAGRVATIYGDGKQTRDFVYVEDITDACFRGALVGGGRYLNIGTGVETTVLELYARIAAAAGVVAAPRFAAARSGEQQRSCLDSRAAQKHLGWEPWTSLDDGLRSTVDWLRRTTPAS
jgi:UDP-glucose 4-epimerase